MIYSSKETNCVWCVTVRVPLRPCRYRPGKHRLLQGWHALLCDDCQKTEPAGERSHSACEWSKPSARLCVCVCVCVCVFECSRDNCWILYRLCVADMKAILYAHTDRQNQKSVPSVLVSFIPPVFYALSVFAQYQTNGLTKPTKEQTANSSTLTECLCPRHTR